MNHYLEIIEKRLRSLVEGNLDRLLNTEHKNSLAQKTSF